ncbi:MAG: hypothetical protein J5556_05215, partial [Deltaproteobacteria bacterium]|nr:hypothetical protein [Deltaproteobacteria bacterium]
MFDFAWKFTLAHEGGLCDDAGDPGGITKYGVDLRMLKSIGADSSGRAFLRKIGVALPVCRASVISLSKAQAAEIYRHEVWDRLGLGRFPQNVGAALFDAGVNHGPALAVRFVQRAHNSLCPGVPLAVDGILGPKTAAALIIDDEKQLARAMINKREAWYHAHAEAVPSQRK